METGRETEVGQGDQMEHLYTGWGNESNSRKRSNGQYFIIKIQGMPGDKQQTSQLKQRFILL